MRPSTSRLALGVAALLACKSDPHGPAPDAAPATVAITVVKRNAGDGIITSNPPGITCGATCTARFPVGTQVTFSAQPDRQSALLRFGGACVGATCTLTPMADQTVEVHLQPRACDSIRPELPGLLCPEDPVPGPATLSSTWASAPGDLWAVGETGVLWRYDGFAWYQVLLPGRPRLTGISGTAPDDVWLVGFAGAVLHYDGMSFSTVAVPAAYAGQALFYGVHARARDDVWVVGSNAVLRRGEGGQFRAVDTDLATGQPLKGDLYAVVARGPSEAYAAGSGGALWRFDGTGWQRQQSPSRGDLHALALDGDRNIVAAGYPYGGDNGVGDLVRYDGAAWTLQADGTPSTFFASLALRGADLFAASDSGVWRRSGARWSAEALPPRSGQGGVLVPDGDGVQLLRIGGAVLRRDAAGTWTQRRGRGALFGMVAFPSAAFAVGEAGLILAYNGQRWQPRPLAQPTEQSLYDVWGQSADDVWAVGGGATLLRARGGAFAPVSDPAVTGGLFGVFGTAADNVWFVGAQGMTYQYRGGALKAIPSGASANLVAIHGSAADDLWAVGPGATMLRNRGAGWQPVPVPPGSDLSAVYALSPTEAYAAGDGGTLLRWDGQSWTRVVFPSSLLPLGALRAIGGTSQDLWVAGSGGVVLHHDGKSWAAARLRAQSISLLRIATSGADRWLSDNYGGIYRYRP